MPENFLTLSAEDRLEALRVATTNSGRPEHLLEKDVMVVWAVHHPMEFRAICSSIARS